MIVSSIFTQPQPLEYHRVPEVPTTIPEIVVVELRDELIPICQCESDKNLTHYGEDGELLRGRVNPLDRGKCQINMYHWGDFAEDLELDWLNNEEDYNTLANHIYEENGASPWIWSNPCHHFLD